MPPDKKLEKLKNLLTELNDGLTRQEFGDALKTVIEHVKSTDTRLGQELVLIKDSVERAIKRIENSSEKEIETIKASVMDKALTPVEESMNKMMLEHEAMMAECDAKMSEMKDGEDGVDADEERVVQTVLARIPKEEPKEETPEETRDKLESIQGEDDKLEMKAIGHLIETIEDLKKRIADISSRPVVGFAGRDIVKNYDISASLDGVTKTFQTPAMYRLFDVRLSSFPSALRENIDYTWTGTEIRFTDQIDASTSLAAGQTAILLYTSL